ncbi:hypothetical protein QBC38DRAFT_196306 [Podospora fimiseda]|uniref:2EXR domain-containing protein n=1 Tax=Podospora fimiseda TaxID=252190 RepID=A0AAN7BPT0_9PEZI|nr:hypothetical protein QBC38DRAFT_196306 [Podospora fimiseda]
MSQDDTFYQFRKLPPELQDMVWTSALPSTNRIIRIEGLLFKDHYVTDNPLNYVEKTSDVSQACSRARCTFLRGCISPSKLFGLDEPIWFNPRTDIIHLDHRSIDWLDTEQLRAIVDLGFQISLEWELRGLTLWKLDMLDWQNESLEPVVARWELIRRAAIKQKSWFIVDPHIVYLPRLSQRFLDFCIPGKTIGDDNIFYVERRRCEVLKVLKLKQKLRAHPLLLLVAQYRHKVGRLGVLGDLRKYLRSFTRTWHPGRSDDGGQGNNNPDEHLRDIWLNMLVGFEEFIPVIEVRVMDGDGPSQGLACASLPGVLALP